MPLFLRCGKVPGLAGTGECQACDNTVKNVPAHRGPIETVLDRFGDCGKTVGETKAQICRTGYRFTKDFSGKFRQTGAAPRAAAIYTQQQKIWPQHATPKSIFRL
jgi:hypothetical protein